MRIAPVTLVPLPGPQIPIPFVPGNGNGGIVPPWLRDTVELPVEPIIVLPVEPQRKG